MFYIYILYVYVFFTYIHTYLSLSIIKIANVLMPLYQSQGKFIETSKSISTCAIGMVIMHIPTNYSVKGFDMHTCLDWNQRDLFNLQNRMAITNHFLKLDKILLCVCHASFSGTIATYANATDFCEDHAIGVFTKGIHGVLNEIPVSSICSFKKSVILIENM